MLKYAIDLFNYLLIEYDSITARRIEILEIDICANGKYITVGFGPVSDCCHNAMNEC